MGVVRYFMMVRQFFINLNVERKSDPICVYDEMASSSKDIVELFPDDSNDDDDNDNEDVVQSLVVDFLE